MFVKLFLFLIFKMHNTIDFFIFLLYILYIIQLFSLSCSFIQAVLTPFFLYGIFICILNICYVQYHLFIINCNYKIFN